MADCGHASHNRGIEVSRTALVANTNGQILKNDKAPLVPQRLRADSPLPHNAIAMFARKLVLLDFGRPNIFDR